MNRHARPTARLCKAAMPAQVSHFFGQLDSDDRPAVYRPNAEGVITQPIALFVPSLLAQGYTVLDGAPAPGPVRGWSFRDRPFLDWLGARPF